MSSKATKIPPSKGKFRRDVFDRAMKIVGEFSPGDSPYEAFGASRASKSVWDPEKSKELKGLSRSKPN